MQKIPTSILALLVLSILAVGTLGGCAQAEMANKEETNPEITTPAENVNDTTSTTPAASPETIKPEVTTTKPETESVAKPAPQPAPAPTPTPTPVTEPAPAPAPAPTTSKYSESASYQSPAGTENVTFNFAVQNGTITSVSLAAYSQNQVSKKFQGFFIEGINQLVAGKKISELGEFSRVNGSSLTPKAFNVALAQLKAKI